VGFIIKTVHAKIAGNLHLSRPLRRLNGKGSVPTSFCMHAISYPVMAVHLAEQNSKTKGKNNHE
jgi:hypothetical protein